MFLKTYLSCHIDPWTLYNTHFYTGCPEKGGTLDFVILKFEFHLLDKTLSFEKNDTKIIWFDLLVLILQPFLETQSFTNFVKSAQAIYGGYSYP